MGTETGQGSPDHHISEYLPALATPANYSTKTDFVLIQVGSLDVVSMVRLARFKSKRLRVGLGGAFR